MNGERATDRVVISITGSDRVGFLQGMVTNDIDRLNQGLVYAALLTPQGKYLADFFLFAQDDGILIDVQESLADSLMQRLTMYKLRADVAVEKTSVLVQRGLGMAPDSALSDPRHTALGWRAYGSDQGEDPSIDWDRIRVEHCIPETGIELTPNNAFILEAGFERLSGVDFKKGCYVGQEVTARMKHKTELRKGFATVLVDGAAPVGTEIFAAGKSVGTLFTQSGGLGIAYLRFERAQGDMTADTATIRRKKTSGPEDS